MRKIVLLLAGIVLALTACGAPAPEDGSVLEKQHHDGYYYSVMYCGMYDSKMNCRFWMWRQEFEPPYWKFKLSKTGTDDVEHVGWRHVSSVDYGYYKVGDYFPGETGVPE